MDNTEKIIRALRATADTQELIYKQQTLGYRSVRLRNGSWNLMRKAADRLEWKFPEQDMKDLDVIHSIRSGETKKHVERDYAIYNGDWYREHPWNVPKVHEPHLLSPDEFCEVGTGWIEHWCSIEDDSGKRRLELFFERCAWCGKTLTTNEFLISLESGDMRIEYGKTGGFRVWAGDFAPSEEMRKEAKWHA